MALARLIICLLGVTTIVLGAPNTRILEGTDAKSGEVPHMASVRLDNAHVCGGTIITQHHVITAGHCISYMRSTPHNASRVNVRVGSVNQFAGGQILQAKALYIHPSYGNFLHDIGIIEFSQPIEWSNKIQPAELPALNEEVEEGTEVAVNGWGLQATGASPYKLQHAKLRTLGHAECEYRAGFGYDSVLCLDHAEKEGICRGDDGTGVTVGNKLVGVASFAFGSCGTKYPDVATDVSYYHEWIESIIKQNA